MFTREHMTAGRNIAATVAASKKRTAVAMLAIFTVVIAINVIVGGRQQARGPTSQHALFSPVDDFLVSKDWSYYDVRRRNRRNSAATRALPAALFPGLVELAPFDGGGHEVRNVSREVGFVIYNRVPKCGSTAVLHVVNQLQRANNFTRYSSASFASHSLPIAKEAEFASYATSEPAAASGRDFLYEKHMYYIDIERYVANGSKPEAREARRRRIPNWVNFVRHPVERVISEFYYMRTKRRWAKNKHQPSKEWFDKSLDECVLRGDAECNFGGSVSGGPPYREIQLTYFCGNAPECKRMGSKAALRQAKRNAERGYSLVGVTEQMGTSLAVLEAALPRFFSRGAEVYSKSEPGARKLNANAQKPETSARAVNVLSKQLALDIEFYEFARQRLANMAANFGVKTLVKEEEEEEEEEAQP